MIIEESLLEEFNGRELIDKDLCVVVDCWKFHSFLLFRKFASIWIHHNSGLHYCDIRWLLVNLTAALLNN
jgi:hypothetical protein